MLQKPPAPLLDTVAVEVKGIFLAPGSMSPVVVLRETDGNRSIPIWIGLMEAEAIGRRLTGKTVPRPLTHDLLGNAVAALGGDIRRIVVTDLIDGTYYARIDVVANRDSLSLDARPSDAIALALGVSAPIFVATAVMDQAGEEDLVIRDPSETAFEPEEVGCGIWCQPLAEEMGEVLGVEAGVLVADLSEALEASAELQRGDVITQVGGQPVESIERLRELLSGLQPGDPVAVQVLRVGEIVTVELTCR